MDKKIFINLPGGRIFNITSLEIVGYGKSTY